MTKEQALQIKEWRLHYEGEGCSWRVLAQLAYDNWGSNLPATENFPNPYKPNYYGNQLYGRDLHTTACNILNEDFDIDEKN